MPRSQKGAGRCLKERVMMCQEGRDGAQSCRRTDCLYAVVRDSVHLLSGHLLPSVRSRDKNIFQTQRIAEVSSLMLFKKAERKP